MIFSLLFFYNDDDTIPGSLQTAVGAQFAFVISLLTLALFLIAFAFLFDSKQKVLPIGGIIAIGIILYMVFFFDFPIIFATSLLSKSAASMQGPANEGPGGRGDECTRNIWRSIESANDGLQGCEHGPTKFWRSIKTTFRLWKILADQDPREVALVAYPSVFMYESLAFVLLFKSRGLLRAAETSYQQGIPKNTRKIHKFRTSQNHSNRQARILRPPF